MCSSAIKASLSFVVSNRTGGIISLGQPAFYQSAFLGGQGNLLGFRQYRFAGRHAAFDNFECRVKLAEVSSYILPGELGLSGFVDIGRVWDQHDRSDTWHNGAGAGIYYVPAQLAVFRLIAGHSSEGWYPYISMVSGSKNGLCRTLPLRGIDPFVQFAHLCGRFKPIQWQNPTVMQ